MSKCLKIFIIVNIILAALGLVLIFESVTFSLAIANHWLKQEGGVVDTSNYQLIFKNMVANFRWTGIIAFAIGLAGAVSGYFKWIKNPKNKSMYHA